MPLTLGKDFDRKYRSVKKSLQANQRDGLVNNGTRAKDLLSQSEKAVYNNAVLYKSLHNESPLLVTLVLLPPPLFLCNAV